MGEIRSNTKKPAVAGFFLPSPGVWPRFCTGDGIEVRRIA